MLSNKCSEGESLKCSGVVQSNNSQQKHLFFMCFYFYNWIPLQLSFFQNLLLIQLLSFLSLLLLTSLFLTFLIRLLCHAGDNSAFVSRTRVCSTSMNAVQGLACELWPTSQVQHCHIRLWQCVYFLCCLNRRTAMWMCAYRRAAVCRNSGDECSVPG